MTRSLVHGRWPRVLASAAVVSVLALSGCARSRQATGGGDKVGFCAAYTIYNQLPEPPPSDVTAVTGYADSVGRVVDRVDTSVRVDGADLPAQVVADLAAVKQAMRTLASQYGAAHGDPAKERAAEATLTGDVKAAAADLRLTAFFQAHCRKKSAIEGGFASQ